jgi:hypothetical protein
MQSVLCKIHIMEDDRCLFGYMEMGLHVSQCMLSGKHITRFMKYTPEMKRRLGTSRYSIFVNLEQGCANVGVTGQIQR